MVVSGNGYLALVFGENKKMNIVVSSNGKFQEKYESAESLNYFACFGFDEFLKAMTEFGTQIKNIFVDASDTMMEWVQEYCEQHDIRFVAV